MVLYLKILLVEDDDLFAMTVTKSIRMCMPTAQVSHVTRVDEAVTILQETRFDVVLTDLTLPDAIDLEAVSQLQKANANVPLIVLTASEADGMARRILEVGGQDFLVKDDLIPQVLERTIRHAIQRQKIVSHNSNLIERLRKQQTILGQKNTQLEQVVATAHRFVDNVSHEFRTPLTVVREYASLMADGLLGAVNDEQAEFLNVIRYRVDDLNTMVDDMLDSSKLAAGIMGMTRVSTTAAAIIERPLAGLQLKAKIRGVEVTLDIPDQLSMIFCDPEKAGRVVTNLTSNAIKFCDETTGSVCVKVRHIVDSGDVEISIADNGQGIEEKELGQLFERFRQLGNGLQSNAKGFGLGLNIARELVDLNFGVITVESAVDVGTTFRFSVPVDNWSEIVRRYAKRAVRNQKHSSVCVIKVDVPDAVDPAFVRDIDAFWRFTDRQPDLVRRTASHEWTLLFGGCRDNMDEIVESVKRNHRRVNRNRTKPMPSLTFGIAHEYLLPAQIEELVAHASMSEGFGDAPTKAPRTSNTREQDSPIATALTVPKPQFLKSRGLIDVTKEV